MKKPFWMCTRKIAPVMTAAIPKTARRVRQPKKTPRPPKNSAAITSIAMGAGMPCLVKASTVPLNPAPPHQPSIFCAPCAKKITPSASRMTNGPRRAMRASSAVGGTAPSERDHAARHLPLLHRGERVAHLGDLVAAGDELVEFELPGAVEVGQARDVSPHVGAAVKRAAQGLFGVGEVDPGCRSV